MIQRTAPPRSSLPWRLVFSPRHGAIRRLAVQLGKATSRSPPGRFRPLPSHELGSPIVPRGWVRR